MRVSRWGSPGTATWGGSRVAGSALGTSATVGVSARIDWGVLVGGVEGTSRNGLGRLTLIFGRRPANLSTQKLPADGVNWTLARTRPRAGAPRLPTLSNLPSCYR